MKCPSLHIQSQQITLVHSISLKLRQQRMNSEALHRNCTQHSSAFNKHKPLSLWHWELPMAASATLCFIFCFIATSDAISRADFPSGFVFGTASSSFQVRGHAQMSRLFFHVHPYVLL